MSGPGFDNEESERRLDSSTTTVAGAEETAQPALTL